MAATSQPISYDVQKAIFKHMDVNRRLAIAQRCPALRAAERGTPLHIDFLDLQPYGFQINMTRYNFGILRIIKEKKEKNEFIDEMNSEGGAQYEMDVYGVKDCGGEDVKYPGDIAIPEDERERELVLENLCLRELVDMKNELYRAQRESLELRRRPPRQRIPFPGVQESDEDHSDSEDTFSSDEEEEEDFEREFEKIETYLAPYYYRRQKIRPPYDFYIQFKNGMEGVERLVYGDQAKMHRAVHEFAERTFGGRRSPIVVRLLNVCTYGAVLRLSEGFKLRVQQLRYGDNFEKMAHVLEAILDKSSFPLKDVSCGVTYKNAMLSTAEQLLIDTRKTPKHGWLNFLLHVKNRKVLMISNAVRAPDFVKLVEDWMRHGKPVGTCFCFASTDNALSRDVYYAMRQHRKSTETKVLTARSRMFPNCFTFPMSKSTELNVYGDVFTQRPYEENLNECYWQLKIEVCPIGFAEQLKQE